MLSNPGVLNRRQFLKSLFFAPTAAIAKPANPVKHHQPLPGVCQPEFWFGDAVQQSWIDEETDEAHSERGEVCGLMWNSTGAHWEYQVNWLSSTAYPASDYPVCDDSFWSADVLLKVGNHAG